jgi:tryptophanyl-tRNA synthetase
MTYPVLMAADVLLYQVGGMWYACVLLPRVLCSVPAGLMTYPALMGADILLYQGGFLHAQQLIVLVKTWQ